MHVRAVASLIALAALVFSSPAFATPDRAELAAAQLVKRMTLEEKASQLASTSPAIPRIGLPAYQWWTEGLHGVVSREDTTNFPAPIGLAATFDDSLVRQVAGAISEEARALHTKMRIAGQVGMFGEGGGLDVWAPNINIFRDPRWGRGQETYGEDPFLTATLGMAYVRGAQGPNASAPLVIATPKHFAVHSGPEPTRRTADVKVSLHDLEDTYLPAFKATIAEAHTGSVMCAYNAVNGQPACANDFLLKTKLRGEWNFQGYVASDCGAVEALQTKHKYVPDDVSAVAAALKAGVDLECIHPNQRRLVQRYLDAVQRGLLTNADIDRSVTRLLAARIRVGDIAADGRPIVGKPSPVLTEAHRAVALRSAEESLVLLKNDGLLPLREPRLKIVVTGPLADSVRVLRSSYSSPNMPAPVSVLAGLRAQFPRAEIRYVPAGPSLTDGDPVPAATLRTTDGHPGVTAHYFAMTAADATNPARAMMSAAGPAFEGTPFKRAIIDRLGQDVDANRSFYKAVYSGMLIPRETGVYRLGLKGMFSKLTFDGKPIAKLQSYPPPQFGDLATVRLEAGHAYPFQVEAMKAQALSVQLVWARVSEDPSEELRRAARDADLVVAAVGLNADLESEESGLDAPGFKGGDRTSLDLPADQQALLEAAKSTGKKLIVVNMSGSAVNLSWAQENAAAVVQAWYPGEEGGTAVARLLAGKFNPSGRLPVTFYRSVADLPPFDDYGMKGRTYRYFDGKPLYPFGYGLSFTAYHYGAVQVRGSASAGRVEVRAELTNAGGVAGDEVAQLYLNFPAVPGTPHVALRGFKRVHLAPGETRTVSFVLTPLDLSSVSPAGERRVLAGRYRVNVGGGQPGAGASTASAELMVQQTLQIPQ